MDITVYLPEDIGQWAKTKNLNLSRLLREAVERLRTEEQEMESTLKGAELVKLPVEDRDGRSYTLRFTGVALAEHRTGEVYLTDDERVIVYDSDKSDYSVVEDAEEELRGLLDFDAYIETMNSLGISPEVDLD